MNIWSQIFGAVKRHRKVASKVVAVSSAGTRVQLFGDDEIDPQTKGYLTLMPHPDNAGNIYIGDNAVDSTYGFVNIVTGGVMVEYFDVQELWIDADEDGDQLIVIGGLLRHKVRT